MSELKSIQFCAKCDVMCAHHNIESLSRAIMFVKWYIYLYRIQSICMLLVYIFSIYAVDDVFDFRKIIKYTKCDHKLFLRSVKNQETSYEPHTINKNNMKTHLTLSLSDARDTSLLFPFSVSFSFLLLHLHLLLPLLDCVCGFSCILLLNKSRCMKTL